MAIRVHTCGLRLANFLQLQKNVETCVSFFYLGRASFFGGIFLAITKISVGRKLGGVLIFTYYSIVES
jgi:hypothetical protein